MAVCLNRSRYFLLHVTRYPTPKTPTPGTVFPQLENPYTPNSKPRRLILAILHNPQYLIPSESWYSSIVSIVPHLDSLENNRSSCYYGANPLCLRLKACRDIRLLFGDLSQPGESNGLPLPAAPLAIDLDPWEDLESRSLSMDPRR